MSGVDPTKPQAPRVVVLLRQFLYVSVLRPYFPGGGLNSFPSALGQLKATPTPSPHRLQLGLPGYLIRFAPLAFVPHRQNRSSQTPSQQAVLPGLQNFTSTLGVPLTSPDLKSNSISSNSHS